jgi:hypothetical protein
VSKNRPLRLVCAVLSRYETRSKNSFRISGFLSRAPCAFVSKFAVRDQGQALGGLSKIAPRGCAPRGVLIHDLELAVRELVN